MISAAEVLMPDTLLQVTTLRKVIGTRGNVTACNKRDMSDHEWRHLKEPWERLQWARLRWQRINGERDNKAAAARALGMDPGTYRTYERPPDKKDAELTYPRAQQFARKFGVDWFWLLEGKGSPFDRQVSELSDPVQRVIGIMLPLSEERQTVLADAVEALVRTFTQS